MRKEPMAQALGEASAWWAKRAAVRWKIAASLILGAGRGTEWISSVRYMR